MEATFVVLLVEDDAEDRTLFARLLTQSHRFVKQAATLAEGLRILSEGGIDVVLLDLNLPDTAGIDGVRRLAAPHPTLPIVVLTGLDDEAVGLKAVQEGAQDYLIKDQVDRRLLDRSLRYAIERKRSERTLAYLTAVVAGMCHECGRKLAPEGVRSFQS